MTPDSPPLQAAFEHQDEIFAPAFLLLQEAITRQAFPAASVAVAYRGQLIALKSLGHFIYETPSGELTAGAPSFPRSVREGGDFDSDITPTTLFDLASLTKVVATTTMAMLLYERGLLDLEAPVSAIVPEFIHDSAKDPRRHDVTLRMLLAHSSGLPAYEKLFLKARTRDAVTPSRLHHATSCKSRHPRRLQRHRIHNPRHRLRTPRRRNSRPLLPA